MTDYIVPILFVLVLLIAAVRKKDSYGAFIEGSRSALSLMASVFPYLLAVLVAVEVFRQSGVSVYVSRAAAPVLGNLGIPPELTELIIIRPLSGAGALGVLENIFTQYGADSFVGKCASVIYGSSETVFYIATIYFSQSNVKKLGYAVPVALLATFIGCIIGCAVARVV